MLVVKAQLQKETRGASHTYYTFILSAATTPTLLQQAGKCTSTEDMNFTTEGIVDKIFACIVMTISSVE